MSFDHLGLTPSIDLVASKEGTRRGVAFIVFEDQASATAAYRGLQGDKFYGRELRITYSKTDSNATLSRHNPGMSKEAAALEAARMVVSRAQDEYEALERDREAAENEAKRKADEADQPPAKRVRHDDEDEMEIEMEDDDDGEWGWHWSRRGALQLLLHDQTNPSQRVHLNKCHLLQSASRVHRGDHGRVVLTVSWETVG